MSTRSLATTRLPSGAIGEAKIRYTGGMEDGRSTKRKRSKTRLNGHQIVDQMYQNRGHWPTVDQLRRLIRNKPVRRDAIAYLATVEGTNPARPERRYDNDW